MSLLSRIAVEAARAYGMFAKKGGISASYLSVAGGGSGGASLTGNWDGGGGGAGGMIASTTFLQTTSTYTIVVGAGGSSTSNGNNSTISGTGLTTIISIGGGAGGISNTVGSNGGSGGGGSGTGAGIQAGGTGTSGQGNNGGSGFNTGNYPGGGGGGAGAVGGNATNVLAGNGGNGSASSISGSSVTYAGGGGGGILAGLGGTGGTGGGGNGSTTTGSAGTANLGGGGGGSGIASGTQLGGAGGSGIVIISYASATPLFVGGTITTSGGNQIHTFTSSGTLSPITPITASYLVVAGGGSGGSQYLGGGGGAGGLLTGSTTIYSGATYVVTVGAGGSTSTSGNGNNGSNSVLSGIGLTTLTSIGGGGGGSYSGSAGNNGGSGGGQGGLTGTSTGPGTGTSGQGNNGGNGAGSPGYGAGGGGGAGAVGGNATTTLGGSGGVGSASSISGTSTYYAGGGGGSAYGAGGGTAGSGGNGGGGAGGTGNGSSGTPNTGGGGGGADRTTVNSGQGGSGVVIISYAGSQVFNGGLVTTSGGNTIHTFTSSGALTPLTNNLNNSLRFRSSASAYLSRTFATSGTNNKIQTISLWTKRGILGARQFLIGGYDGSAAFEAYITFSATDTIVCAIGGASNTLLETTQVFRDPSSWYHIVFAIDTTQATAANRYKLYINGNQITSFTTANYPTQNYVSQFAYPSTYNTIGKQPSSTTYLDAYQTDINFIDGQALEPYYFGNNDANGVWKPIQYKGTYGTNGFYLTFGNTTSTTTLGYDSSPNGNNWTCNNISLTAGTTYDAMTDVPTNTSATVANYCVINPIKRNVCTISNANLTAAGPATYTKSVVASMSMPSGSGKYYWEAVFTRTSTTDGDVNVGIVSTTWNAGEAVGSPSVYPGNTSDSWGVSGNSGNKINNASQTSYGSSFASGDIIMVAYDAVNGSFYVGKNGTWFNSGVPASNTGYAFTGITTEVLPGFGMAYDSGSSIVNANFGQRPFSYTPPTGFVALNTYNLPTPTILQGNKYMDATLWTGTGVSNVIVNQAQFKPDLVWIKGRNTTYSNVLYDSIRGATNYLVSDSTAAQVTDANSMTAFNSNGFSVGSSAYVNGSGASQVGWQWQAGQGSTSSNTSGSITSTVSVNTTAGFSVVTYTGSASGTVGHGLGVAPKFIILKQRNVVNDWVCYHVSTGVSGILYLNLTDAVYTGISNYWGSSITSTTFGTGSNSGYVNANGNIVAYCFAEIAGFSKFGSYTGNGSTDGPFVYLGFRPKFVMIKRTDSADDWIVMDSARNTYNVANSTLFPNGSYAETTDANRQEDFLSNGFKVRSSPVYINASGGTYIYAAFAENPFKNSNAR